MRNLFGAFLSLVAIQAWAFPEMIRHGYAHCAACHFNPAGGGALTPYGRSISSELLSSWSYTGEERIFHGALSQNASSYIQGEKDLSLILGGDARWIQVHQENSAVRRRKAFFMQVDAEFGAKWKKFLVLSTFGQEKIGETERYRFRKTFAKVDVTESVSVKAGRSAPNLGLMVSEHFLSSRSDSGLGPLEYKDLVEVQGNFENFGFVVGGERTPFERSGRPSSESGGYLQGDYIIDNHKFGLHYWYRQADAFTRHRIGGHSMLGFTKRLALLTDWQFQQEKTTGAKRHWGAFASGKFTYEPVKGLWLSAWLDYAQTNLDNNKTGRSRFGPGLQFFPRPHLEIEALWLRERSNQRDEWGDYAMLIAHYYL